MPIWLEPSVRKTDKNRKTYFRSPAERLFLHEGKWYFQAREGDRGPYDTREMAELRLKRYIETLGFIDDYEPWKPVSSISRDSNGSA